MQIILPFAKLKTSTFAGNLAFSKISSSTRVISSANSLKASLVGSLRSLVKVLSFSVNDPLKVSGFSIGFVFVEVSFSQDGSVGSVTGVDSPGVVEDGRLVKSVDEEVGRVIETTDEEEDDEVIGMAAEGNFGGLAGEVDGMREDFIWLVEEDA